MPPHSFRSYNNCLFECSSYNRTLQQIIFTSTTSLPLLKFSFCLLSQDLRQLFLILPIKQRQISSLLPQDAIISLFWALNRLAIRDRDELLLLQCEYWQGEVIISSMWVLTGIFLQCGYWQGQVISSMWVLTGTRYYFFSVCIDRDKIFLQCGYWQG